MKPAATMSMRDRKRAEARARVAAVALGLFAERGYGGVSVAEICEVAGVAQRSFFRYFPTKEDVLLEPIRESSQRLEQAIAEAPSNLVDAEVLDRALRQAGADAIADWRRLDIYFDVVRETDVVRSSPLLQLAGRERAIADLLLVRRGAIGPPDWGLRLLIARRIAAYRVWLEDVRTSDAGDPLDHLDRVLAAA